MLFQLADETGHPLDAHFEVEGTDILFHSRGGTIGRDVRNSDYAKALRLLLQRAQSSGNSLLGVWVDSSRVQHLPLSERRILTKREAGGSPEGIFTVLSNRMKDVGRLPGTRGGNPTKKLRLRYAAPLADSHIRTVFRAVPSSINARPPDLLPTETLQRVTAEHVWNAAERLAGGEALGRFGPSTDFDLLCQDGTRLPPKAVFGLAASQALGFEVLPRHFKGGVGTPCFRILEDSGFEVVPKGERSRSRVTVPSPDDEEWEEGGRRLVTHYKAERKRGLAAAKKARFRREHGHLYCEKCGLEPTVTYGATLGDACIEVHHRATLVSEMERGHRSRLEDVECLCANCHRVAHRALRLQAIAAAVVAT